MAYPRFDNNTPIDCTLVMNREDLKNITYCNICENQRPLFQRIFTWSESNLTHIQRFITQKEYTDVILWEFKEEWIWFVQYPVTDKKNNADPQLVSWLFTSHQNSLDDFVWLGLLQTTCISTDIWHIWFVSNLYILCQGTKVTFGITKFIMSRSLVEEKYQMRLLCKTLWREEPWFYHDILPHLTYLMFWGAMVMNPWEEIWLVMGVWGCEASHWSVSSGQTAVAVELVLSWRNDGHWLALT